jgi:hypothetical protein
MLGLPRIGRYDCPSETLPFSLITTNQIPKGGRHVVEVHPALALWLWLKKAGGNSSLGGVKEEELCHYKADIECRRRLWCYLSTEFSPILAGRFTFSTDGVPCDDEIDAIVAYILARSWHNGDKSVAVLGDARCGAMLLPAVDNLQVDFNSFRSEELKRRTKEC